MTVRRIVPNIASRQLDECRDFYSRILGLELAMDLGWIATYVSPTNRTAQVSICQAAEGSADSISITVEVDDVDRVHAAAVASGYPVVYPLTDEPWGVRRFAVKDPNGVVLNIMRHIPPP